MLYDRPYMRKPLAVSFKSGTDYIILFLIIIFVLQSILKFFLLESLLLSVFSLSFDNVISGMIWSTLTYSFLHDGPLHLIFNILGIHFISRNVELHLSKSSFISFYFFSVFAGSILWLIFSTTGSSLIGSSAFVMASLSYFCLKRPDSPITFLLFFVLPITLRPKFLLIGVLGIEIYGFLFSELNNTSGIAHSAHLGGMMAGAFMTTKYFNYLSLPKFTFRDHNKNSHKTKSDHSPSYTINLDTDRKLEAQVDKILDKINERGFGCLTKSEKDILEKAKSLFNEKPNSHDKS